MLITLSSNDYWKLKLFADRYCPTKILEDGHRIDNNQEYKRCLTGYGGEMAVERLFGIEFIDWSIGHSKDYWKPDLSPFLCGIKTAEEGKGVLILKKPVCHEIIVRKLNDTKFDILGVAPLFYLKQYQNDNLIIDKNIRERGLKTAFTGYKKLIPFKNYEEFKNIMKSI